MTSSTSKQLNKAELLFDEGKLNEALELLDNKNIFEELNLEVKSRFQDIKALILFYQNKSSKLIELGELIFEEGRSVKNNLRCLDGLFFIACGLDQEKKFDIALNKIDEAEVFLKKVSNIPKKVTVHKQFRLNVLKTMIDIHIGRMDAAEKSLEEFLSSEEELEITWELLWAITNLAFIKLISRGEFDIALEYSEKAMNYAENMRFNHFWKGYCLLGIGVIHIQKCEYKIGIKYHMKSLEYFNQIDNDWYVAHIHSNLGLLYWVKGDYDTALEYLEKAIVLWEPYPLMKDECLCNLIEVSLKKGDTERARQYFKQLKILYKENKDLVMEENYKYSKAILLKISPRIRDKAEAQELLNEIIKTGPIYFETKINAYVNLCDLLLTEYRLNNDPEVLTEVKQYLKDLLTLAENSRSFYIFCNAFILQARLALFNFEVKTARRFLIQAQKIAESYGIKRLAMRISHEHDELIKKTKKWENLKKSDLSISERWKLAGLDDQMEKMVRKGIIDFTEIKNEEPVLLLIVSERGKPFFYHSFIEDKFFESNLFGGFLSTIDYFIKDVFSEGLDRVMFGDFILLMKSVPPFFISYVFKGDSYYANKKLNYFMKKIQNNDFIWNKVLEHYQKSQIIQPKDVPLLDSLITELFVTNRIFSKE